MANHKAFAYLGNATEIVLKKRRFICSCDPNHPFDESFEFLRKYQRQTVSFEKYVFMLSHKNTIKNVSEIIDISEGKCQRIYNYHASVLLKDRKPEPLRLLGIDDIAHKKGHNYNTVIYNQETDNIVAIFTGRKKDDVVNYLKGWSE